MASPASRIYGLGRLASQSSDIFRADAAMSRHVDSVSRADLLAIQQPVLWKSGPILDQDAQPPDYLGQTPYCVGFMLADHLNGEPHAHPDLDPGGLALYNRSQQHDGFPLPHEGSTVHGGLQALVDLGLASPNAAVWAFDEWTVRKFVLTAGPVMIGTNWYRDMFAPDAQGIVHINDSEMVGGHAWSIWGYDWNCFGKLPASEHGLYLCMNHWGTGWGVARPDAPGGEAGYFLISHGDLARLLAEDGEACAVLNWSGVTPV